ERLFEYSADEVVGRNIDDVLDARDALGNRVPATGSDSSSRRLEDEIPNLDLEVRTRSDGRIWVNVSTIVFKNRRTGRRLFARLLRDISQHRLNEELLNRMLDAARQLVSRGQALSHHAAVEALSEQELRILKLFAEGRSSSTIARKLSISAQTLRNHLHHINQKLRTHSRLEAVTHAQRRGLIV
ncbi:MAG TPA: LuxR C-terminal-related transcriptional regulator, partial [Gemmatimonadaceae bacterium]